MELWLNRVEVDQKLSYEKGRAYNMMEVRKSGCDSETSGIES